MTKRMTSEEAIEVLQQDIPCEHDTDLIEALDMAIKALEQEPCGDFISRQEALDTIPKVIGGQNDFADCIRDSVEAVINACPSVQPKAKTGKWVNSQRGIIGRIVKCDQCGNFLGLYAVNGGRGDANFCPNCGSRNEREDKE